MLTPPPVEEASLEAQGAPATIDSGVMARKALTQKAPVYPQAAKEHRASGSVVIRVLIGRDGRIRSMALVTTPDPDLAIAALAAVRSWTYEPYLLNGQPTEVDTIITVNFHLSP